MAIASAKVTSKGQITLPAKLRERLGIKPGDRVSFEEDGMQGVRLIARTVTAADLKGILKTNVRLTDEELEEAISSAFGARWKRFSEQDSNDDRD
jgi:AbrB family looped-hinge helix DNA binding protein